jgi:hypothetical protein
MKTTLHSQAGTTALGLFVLLATLGQAAPSTPEPAGKRDPVVVLMDTTARNGVYLPITDVPGSSNARYLAQLLQEEHLLPPKTTLVPEPLSAGWNRESELISRRPDLVIIHRSAFFHTYNAQFNFGATNEFARSDDDQRWRSLYDIADDRLITLMGLIGGEVPQCQFLVYSRGTGTNWLEAGSRSAWVNKVEARFPKLKGRIDAMLITGGKAGSFDNPDTKAELFKRVRETLQLPPKSEPEKTRQPSRP